MKMRNLICFIVFITIFPALYGQSDFQIIINKNIAGETLDPATLKNIYLGKKTQWKDGSKIVPVTLKDGDIHQQFMSEVVKKSVTAFNNYWRKMIFTGKGVPPISFQAEQEVVEYINNTEGAVGYISKENQDALSGFGNVVVEELPQ